MEKSILKKYVKLIPPVVFDFWKRTHLDDYLYYFGHFDTWEEALNKSNLLGGDYRDKSILDRIDEAIQKVRRGEALYEQDGVCYYEENNNWELISALLYTNAILGKIGILDMGGALGSTYFRYRKIIECLDIKWQVVEQKHYVDKGKKTVPEIDFYYSIDECFESGNEPNVLLLSSVLMYLDDPYSMLKDMLDKNFQYAIVDENAFFINENAKDQIMLQHVPVSIYRAVYPAHIFGLEKFRRFVKRCGYEIIWEWVYQGGQIPIKTRTGMKNTIDRGFLLKRVNKQNRGI